MHHAANPRTQPPRENARLPRAGRFAPARCAPATCWATFSASFAGTPIGPRFDIGGSSAWATELRARWWRRCPDLLAQIRGAARVVPHLFEHRQGFRWAAGSARIVSLSCTHAPASAALDVPGPSGSFAQAHREASLFRFHHPAVTDGRARASYLRTGRFSIVPDVPNKMSWESCREPESHERRAGPPYRQLDSREPAQVGVSCQHVAV